MPIYIFFKQTKRKSHIGTFYIDMPLHKIACDGRNRIGSTIGCDRLRW